MSAAAEQLLSLHRAVRNGDAAEVERLLSSARISELDTSTKRTSAASRHRPHRGLHPRRRGLRLPPPRRWPSRPAAWRIPSQSPPRGDGRGSLTLDPALAEGRARIPTRWSEGERTPLVGACFLREGADEAKSASCVRALLEDERTDPTLRNSFGESALDLAKVRGYRESIELVEEAPK
ncbi:hypothetical protein ACHAWF_017067 [Thalassiosira exigua]